MQYPWVTEYPVGVQGQGWGVSAGVRVRRGVCGRVGEVRARRELARQHLPAKDRRVPMAGRCGCRRTHLRNRSAQIGSVPSGIGRNDGVDGMGKIYELRTYVTEPGRMNVLLDRFRNHTVDLFARHGMTSIGYWVVAEHPGTLVYLLSHDDASVRGSVVGGVQVGSRVADGQGRIGEGRTGRAVGDGIVPRADRLLGAGLTRLSDRFLSAGELPRGVAVLSAWLINRRGPVGKAHPLAIQNERSLPGVHFVEGTATRPALRFPQ